jgi:hypothetical protein
MSLTNVSACRLPTRPIQGAISEQDLTSSSEVSSWMLSDSSEYFALLKVKSMCYMVISVVVL